MLDKCTTLWNQMDDETNDYLKTMIWRFENDDMEMISRLISSWHLSSSSMEQAVLVSIPSTMWASWELTMWASCEIDWNLLIEQLNSSHEVWQLNWNCNYRWICEYSIQDPAPLSEKIGNLFSLKDYGCQLAWKPPQKLTVCDRVEKPNSNQGDSDWQGFRLHAPTENNVHLSKWMRMRVTWNGCHKKTGCQEDAWSCFHFSIFFRLSPL